MMLPALDEDEDIEEVPQAQNELPVEYRAYLKRLEEDYLTTCGSFTVIKSFLLTLTANSANIGLCLLAIDFGLGAMAAGLSGFILGAIPGVINLQAAGIDLSSDYKIKDISKLVFGVSQIIGTGGVSYSATGEYRQLMEFAKESVQAFEVEVASYETKVQPSKNLSLSMEMQIVGAISIFLIFIAAIKKFL